MSKILTLSPEEAQQIRNQLISAYKSETGKDFIPVTYLGAYDNLRAFILSTLQDKPEIEASEAEASISVHRLRKLFYYTDPTYCREDKLEALSFGDDFISPLQGIQKGNLPLEIEAVNLKVAHPKSRSFTYIAIGAVLGLILAAYFLISFKFRKPYYFRDDFQNNSIEALKQRGWDFMDFDSSLFFPQDTGVLTLRSSRGDYWVNPEDTPYIKNLIYKELPFTDCFEVTTKVSFKGNIEPFQQCGIFLLDKYKNRIHNIRMTTAYLGEREPDFNRKIYNRGYQMIKRDHGEAFEIQHMYLEKSDTSNNKFYLKIIRNKHQFMFYMHFGEDTDSFTQFGETTFDFEPRFVSLAAFNGLRMSVHGPLNTSGTIPAKFDWLKMQECK